MSVVVRHHAPGMTADQYEAIADVTMGDLQSAKGFVAHYAFLEGDGLTVSEIWDTQVDHDAFFDEYIRPKLPQEIPTPAVFDVLNATTTRNIVGGAAHAARNAVGFLGGAAGGAWSWTRSKLGELTHTSGKAETGPEVEPESTTTPESESAPPQAPPAKGGATSKATATPTPSAAPPVKGGATGKATAKPRSSTGAGGGTSA